jgi:hypothetical protein
VLRAAVWLPLTLAPFVPAWVEDLDVDVSFSSGIIVAGEDLPDFLARLPEDVRSTARHGTQTVPAAP